MEWALAASVADGAVERVVDEEELENTFSILSECLAVGVDYESFATGKGASGGRLRHHANGAVLGIFHPGFHEAHSAHPDWLHSWVVAENWDFKSKALDRLNNEFTFWNL